MGSRHRGIVSMYRESVTPKELWTQRKSTIEHIGTVDIMHRETVTPEEQWPQRNSGHRETVTPKEQWTKTEKQ